MNRKFKNPTTLQISPEPLPQPDAPPSNIPKEQILLSFKKYADEEFKPIKNSNLDYYISNYGRVVSFKRNKPREINGFQSRDFKQGRHLIALVLAGEYRIYSLDRLVYSHFCGELTKDHKVVHKKKGPFPLYYKNLKVRINPKKPIPPPPVKMTKEQEILTFKRYKDEEFKPIKDCNEFYYISNYGRVVSFRMNPAREIFGMPRKNKKPEFHGISLLQQRGSHYFILARLVYSHFCGELKPSMDVVIKNKKQPPLYYKNLKAVARPKAVHLISKSLLKELKAQKTWNIPILQFSRMGVFVREYPDITAGAAAVEIDPRYLDRCLKGEQTTAGGYQWRYKMDPNFDEGICDIPPCTMIGKTVYQFSLEGRFIRSYPSVRRASKKTGEPGQYISRALKGDYNKNEYSYKYQWRDASDPLFKKGIVDIPPVNKVVKPGQKSVVQFTLEGKYVEQYASVADAAKRTGISKDEILQSAYGLRKKTMAYRWRFLKDVNHNGKIENLTPLEAVCQFGMDGKYLGEYPNYAAAGKSLGVTRTTIYHCIKGNSQTACGFQWRRKSQVWKDGKVMDIEPLGKEKRVPGKLNTVCQFGKDGKYLGEYPDYAAAGKSFGVTSTAIYQCIKGNSKTARGYQWRLKSQVWKDGKVMDIEPLGKGKKREKDASVEFGSQLPVAGKRKKVRR